MPLESELMVINFPEAPVKVTVPAKVKIGLLLVWCTKVKVFAAPIPETEKLLKVVVPERVVVELVVKVTVPVRALKPAVPPLLVQLPLKVILYGAVVTSIIWDASMIMLVAVILEPRARVVTPPLAETSTFPRFGLVALLVRVIVPPLVLAKTIVPLVILIQVAPALKVKLPLKVMPVPLVAVNVPLVPPPIVVLPATERVNTPRTNVVPLPTVKVPPIAKLVPVVQVSVPDMVKFTLIDFAAQVNVPLPLIVKLE